MVIQRVFAYLFFFFDAHFNYLYLFNLEVIQNFLTSLEIHKQ